MSATTFAGGSDFVLAADVLPATNAPCCVVSTARSATVAPSRSILSRAERKFIEDGILQSFRVDGRSILDSRPASVEVGTLPSTYGSARIRTSDDTEVIVGVKCEVMRVGPDRNTGDVICRVDCSASVDLELEEKGGQDLANFLSQLAQSLCLGPAAVNRKELSILDGKLSWKVFVDVVVLNAVGNVLDAISLGIRAALMNTILPPIEPFSEIDPETGEEKVDFNVDSRPEVGRTFPYKDIPICVTVGQVQGRFVWDMSFEEEGCATSKLTVAVDSAGRCRSYHKSGIPAGAASPALNLEACIIALKNSCRIGEAIHNRLIKQCGAGKAAEATGMADD